MKRVSRIAHRAFFLTEDERSRFVARLWRVARFSGVDVLSYCFMSNHFHLLIYVPEPSELSDSDLLDRIKILVDGARRPAELRAALGISSANYFTTRYLTPLLKAGFIKTEGEGMRFSPTKSFRLTQKGREAIRQPHHSNPTNGV